MVDLRLTSTPLPSTPAPFASAGEAKRRTALHLAAAQGQLEIAKQVLATRRLAVSAKDADGWLPIHCAAGAGHADIVAALLGAGSDCDEPAADGDTPLHKAAIAGHLAVVQLLKGRSGLDARNSAGSTPLYNAASQGHLAVMRELLQEGSAGGWLGSRAPVVVIDSGRLTVKLQRLRWICMPSCTALQRVGAERTSCRNLTPCLHVPYTTPCAVDAATTNGCSPLYIAANNGCTQAAALLLEVGADPDLETTSGCTPLHAGGAVVGRLLCCPGQPSQSTWLSKLGIRRVQCRGRQAG